MKIAKLIACIAVILIIALAGGWRQPPQPNAAEWYNQAIAQLLQFSQASPQDWELLQNYDTTTPPTPEVRQALIRVQPMLELVRRGASLEQCDFNIDRSVGIEMTLPHLHQMRNVARIMNADITVRLHDGDSSAAANGLADMYRMSGHFGEDRVLISSLVGHAVFSMADRGVQSALDQGLMDAENSAALVSALQRLGTEDPFAYLDAVIGEQDMMVGYMRDHFGDPQKRIDAASLLGVEGEGHPLMMLTEDGLEREIELYDSFMTRMVEVFSMPDRAEAKAEMAAMEKEIEAMMVKAQFGGEGVLIGMMMPALGRILDRLEQAEASVEDRLAILKPLASGHLKPDEFANAALWYMRAIQMMDQLDATRMEELRVFAANTAEPLADDLAEFIASEPVQQTVGVFAEGSTKKRCDFSFVRKDRGSELVPPYLPGMHDGFRLMQVDAVRLLRVGEDDRWDAVDRLATSLRMVGHMGSDPVILSSLNAHRNFLKSIALIETAFANGLLAQEHKPMLVDALERISHGDPFGYIKSIVTTRADLANQLSRQYWPLNTEADAKDRTQFADSVKALTGDQLLFLLAIVSEMKHALLLQYPAEDGSQPPDLSASYRRLWDAISLPDVEATRQQTAQVAPLLAQGSVAFFEGRVIPAIAASKIAGNLTDHTRRARNDLRRGWTVLRQDEPVTARE